MFDELIGYRDNLGRRCHSADVDPLTTSRATSGLDMPAGPARAPVEPTLPAATVCRRWRHNFQLDQILTDELAGESTGFKRSTVPATAGNWNPLALGRIRTQRLYSGLAAGQTYYYHCPRYALSAFAKPPGCQLRHRSATSVQRAVPLNWTGHHHGYGTNSRKAAINLWLSRYDLQRRHRHVPSTSPTTSGGAYSGFLPDVGVDDEEQPRARSFRCCR